MSPRVLEVYADEYNKSQKEKYTLLDVAAFYNGIYVAKAVGSNLSKNVKYPAKPLSEKERARAVAEMNENEFYEEMRQAIRKMNSKFE